MDEGFWRDFWVTVAGIVVVAWMMAMLTGCRTKYVSVPEYHKVFVEKHDTLMHRDSIFEKDSVWMVVSGDTITTYRTKILYRDRWREKIVYKDSIKVDSIRVPYPVERKLGKWEKVKMDVGGIGIGMTILAIIYFVFTIFKKLRARSSV